MIEPGHQRSQPEILTSEDGDMSASQTRRRDWNDRYASTDLVWSAGPNRFVEEQLAGLPAGRALDLGAGEGRNSIWLAQRSWDVTAVDFADVAIQKGSALAEGAGISATWIVEDLVDFQPKQAWFDLVLLAYIHLSSPEFNRVLSMACGALAPQGTLLVIGHDSANIEHGVGGPQDPDVLYTAADIVDQLQGMEVVYAGTILRPVQVDAQELNAIDVMVRAVKR